jgi:superfamily II DNA or RNA helicase
MQLKRDFVTLQNHHLCDKKEILLQCKIEDNQIFTNKKSKLYNMETDKTKEFIAKAKAVHGDKYDYSKVKYVNCSTKVTIICPKHGEFEQTPKKHLLGQGCPDCSGRKRLTTEEFIAKAKAVHGDKFDYSKVKYVNSETKVTIVCPIHGEFEQTPVSHLSGNGCSLCSRKKKHTLDRFIEMANKIHGDKYDYTKVNYVNNKTKVTIICPKHGEFEQTPQNHLKGKGCSCCNIGFTKGYKVSLLKAGDLLHMSPHQLIEVISSKKLPEEFKTLIYSPEDSDKRGGRIKDLINLYESDCTDEEIKEKLSRMADEDEYYLEKKEDLDELTPFGGEKKEDYKHPSVVMSEVHTYDRLLKMKPSDDRDNFIINEETHKLWNSVLRANEEGTLEEEILKIKEEKGGEFFEYVKDIFLKEYEEVVSIEKDKDYRFKYEPSLMQKLMVFYMLHNNSFGNWCGTGAGKTNAFLFASRMTDSKTTVTIVPNDVIDTLCKSIQAIYPDSRIVVPDNPDDLKHYGDGHTYIIYNYEKMQSNNGAEETTKRLLDTNKIDFICLDEVHNAKVRTEETASSRSKNIKDFITKARELNPNVKVLAMSATPFINNLQEVRSIIELITGEEHPEIGYRNTTSNIHNAYKAILLNGFRYIPKYDIAVEERIIEVDCSEDSELLKNLMKNEGNISGVENLLAQKKLRTIEDEIKKGTIVYSPWVNGMADMLTTSISDMGFITEAYNGDSGDKVERKEILDRFRSGETDVLVCSKPISTGVDGLQKCCNKMIIISLPWTDADYTQLKGRIYRQGSVFDKVEFVIPQVVININDKSWSWDKMRKNAVDNKKTIGEAVVDGDIQESYTINKERLLNEAMETLKASAAA